MAAAKKGHSGSVAQNRKARHNYEILEKLEAGIVLTGTEVKSLRQGRATIGEAYAGEMDGELYLLNAFIPEYLSANRFNHEPKRARKLLVKRREMGRLIGAVTREGMTIVPLAVYFNKRGIAKVELALAKGRQTHDKRDAIKTRDWQRQKARLMREKG